MLTRTRILFKHTYAGIWRRGDRISFSIQYPTNQSILLDRAVELCDRLITQHKELSAREAGGSLFERWSPEYEEQETKIPDIEDEVTETLEIFVEKEKEKEARSNGVHRVMGRKTHLVSCIENGQTDLAETLRDELISTGVHIKRHPIFTEAAIDAWRHRSPEERTDAFYNWLRLIPPAIRGQVRQTRLALMKVRNAIFSDPTDLNTIACFGLICCRKGFANAFFPDVIAHIGRLASPALSGALLTQCEDQANAFYNRFHKETHQDSDFSKWNTVKHNNHYVRILCISGYSHHALEWLQMLVNQNIRIEPFTWTLLSRDFAHLKLDDLVAAVKELRIQAILKGLTEESSKDDHVTNDDRPLLPTAQDLAEKLQEFVETSDAKAINALWYEIAVENRSLDLWVVAIMKFYQNNGRPRLVLEQFLSYYMCIGVPKEWILHQISKRTKLSEEKLHPLLSVSIPPNFRPAAGGRFPSTHTIAMVWGALASLVESDTELSSLYETFLYHWDHNHSSTISLPPVDTDRLWKNISIQYPPVITPDTVMFHVFISRFAKSGLIDTTLAILQDMHSRGIRPDTHNWTAVAGMYAKAKDLDRALRILTRMEETNIRSDGEPPHGSTIKNVDRVRNRRGPILHSSVWMPSPNLVTYTSIWRGLVDSGNYEAAREFSDRLESAGYAQGMNERTENVARLLEEREARRQTHQTERVSWGEEFSKRGYKPL